jgi:hypothetical protein
MGKGVYDVHTYVALLGNKIESECVLSHDLVEGFHLHTGFLHGAVFYEQCPSSYFQASMRRHRWIRGDWQNAAWLTPDSFTGSIRARHSTLPRFGRSVVADNICHSLCEIAVLLLMVAGCVLHALNFGRLVCSLGVLLLLPDYISLVILASASLSQDYQFPLKRFLGVVWMAHRKTLCYLVYSGHQALMASDAIMRTIVRVINRKNLLEWTTAWELSNCPDKSRHFYYSYLYVMPALAAVLTICMYMLNQERICLAGPLFLAWALTAPISHGVDER